MKSFVSATVCVVVVLLLLDFSSAYNNLSTQSSHNFEIGARPFADKLFSKELIKVNSQLWSSIKEIRTFSTDGKARITLVKALDQKQNGNGAYVTIINGGPGQTFVTLEFKSQKGHGIDFIVEVYARY